MKHKWFFEKLRTDWSLLTFYERFEQVVSAAISLLIVIVIAIAFGNVVSNIAYLTVTSSNEVHGNDLSVVFGSIMSLLIALEFNHTIFHSIKHRGQIVRVKTVVLIAILVISREFILLDTKTMGGDTIFAYAISAISLGAVYYILDVREQQNGDGERREKI